MQLARFLAWAVVGSALVAGAACVGDDPEGTPGVGGSSSSSSGGSSGAGSTSSSSSGGASGSSSSGAASSSSSSSGGSSSSSGSTGSPDAGPDAGEPAPPSSKLVLWMRGDQGVELSPQNAFVSWTDQASAAVLVTGLNCAVAPTVSRSINGHAVVSFNLIEPASFATQGQCLKIPSLPAFSDFTAGFTTFVVARWQPPFSPYDQTSIGGFFGLNASLAGKSHAISFGRQVPSDGQSTHRLELRFDETGTATVDNHRMLSANIAAANDSAAHLFEVSVAGGIENAPTEGVMLVDGEPVVVPSAASLIVPAKVDRGDNTLGARSYADESDRYFRGDLAEVLIYARQLSAAEHSAVRALLKNRWATP